MQNLRIVQDTNDKNVKEIEQLKIENEIRAI